MTGILVIDKPEGWTSFDVIAKLRGVLGVQKIGHAGTLDPIATGVLPVFVSREATRHISRYESADKEYIAGLRLGVATDTLDIAGRILYDTPTAVPRARLEAALGSFRGDIIQTPPMYSAIKVNGERLYKIARRGGEAERPPRNITVFAAEILEPEDAPPGADWTLRFCVSKGTYIRALCADIGSALGTGGAMSSLRRTRVGEFRIEDALTMEEALSLAGSGEIEAKMRPVE
ncbi:MAG: tRNA pseudouridine(55) synthase TruB [Oscillospiraceae bacterium]|jgi:tRNA pseudouridine55 synthase|nr:tRNA pseudouridine(55) synthase TruB [Oscillospiraceae bacterium]